MSEEQEELLSLLGEVWALAPELRLGQLIINASGEMHEEGKGCAYGTRDSVIRDALLVMREQFS